MSILEKAARRLEDKVLIDMLGGRVANYLKPHVNDLLNTPVLEDNPNKIILPFNLETNTPKSGIIKMDLSTDSITKGRHKVVLDVLELPTSEDRNYDLTSITLIRYPNGELQFKKAKPYEDREINFLKLLSNVNLELRLLDPKSR